MSFYIIFDFVIWIFVVLSLCFTYGFFLCCALIQIWVPCYYVQISYLLKQKRFGEKKRRNGGGLVGDDGASDDSGWWFKGNDNGGCVSGKSTVEGIGCNSSGMNSFVCFILPAFDLCVSESFPWVAWFLSQKKKRFLSQQVQFFLLIIWVFLILLLPWWRFLCFPSPCFAFSSILICWGFFKLLLNLLFHVLCSMFSSISPLHVDCYVPLSPYLMYTGFNFLIRNILKLWFLSQKKQRFLSQQVRFFWLIVWVFLILLLPWWRFLCFPSPFSAFSSISICWG